MADIMSIEITQETQDKFRLGVVDKIKQYFPDADIKTPMLINNERHIALAVNIQEIQHQDGKLDCFPMVYGGSGDSVDDAIQEALNDISKIRFMKRPEFVYIRSSQVEHDMDFDNAGCTVFQARARIVFLYSDGAQ